MGSVQRQVARAALLENLVHEPSTAPLRLGARRRNHEPDGGEVVALREPHRASENAADAVDGNDAAPDATQ
jgi:hypothetical protein